MTLDMKFKVTARCKVYNRVTKENSHTEDIELTLDKKQAMGMLIRFAPPYFMIDEFKVAFHSSDGNTIDSIILIKGDENYIITNMNQFISEIHEGYFRLLSLEKFSSILEYDFDVKDNSDIKDEFE